MLTSENLGGCHKCDLIILFGVRKRGKCGEDCFSHLRAEAKKDPQTQSVCARFQLLRGFRENELCVVHDSLQEALGFRVLEWESTREFFPHDREVALRDNGRLL